jgi:hypothetical protein
VLCDVPGVVEDSERGDLRVFTNSSGVGTLAMVIAVFVAAVTVAA